MLGLLTLPAEVRDALENKKISIGHARVISKLDNEEQQVALTNKIIDEGLSVRQLETLTTSPNTYVRTHTIKKTPKVTNSEYQYLENELSDK